MSKTGPQNFGAQHTQIKLGALANYLPAYTKALRHTGFTLHYIDAFAGTGKCVIKIGGKDQPIPGSAWIALHCQPPFQRMLLIEKVKGKLEELRALVAMFPPRDGVDIRLADANDAVPAYLDTLTEGDRAIVNLDPFGMHVDWTTLQKIADSQLADVWYLFSLSGFYRQAAKDAADIDDTKAAALTRILGPHDWRKALYSAPPQADLFGQASDQRHADPLRMAEWVTGCLKASFPAVVGPKILHMTTPSGKLGPPIFALYFIITNPAPKAIGLATKIANGVFKKL
jgi:three-Cys-motif partner protein